MATTTVSPTRLKGGAFLIEESTPDQVFTPEDFSDEHRAIANAARKGDTKLAAKLMREHILGAGRALVEFLEEHRNAQQANKRAQRSS